ncbi:probable monosaccharide transporter [Serendipita indica DSM 11827]|uniref:Probable monosaccharide transporter n=1 Tax=Serendipita indica (strain DSM 11827) TaxID=1109443 RepID=G4TCE1_SERID|nr:probable monosaccharide transporter [Serendipita indica DSM 11827]
MPGGGAVAASSGMAGGRKSSIVGIGMSCFAAFGGILFGYDTGVISGVKEMKFWLQTFGYPKNDGSGDYTISTPDESLIVSILSLGTFFGALLAAPMGDFLGRRFGVVGACLIFSAGVAMQTGATAVPLFVAGRVFAGLGVGMVSCLVPMYQAESSPKWIRGAVVSCYQWAITIGILLSGCVNQATKDRNDYSSFRIPIAIQFVWAGILAIGMFLLPESPRWLIKKHREEDAARALGRLLSAPPTDPDVRVEIEDIKANLRMEEEIGQSSYADCFKMGPNKVLLRTLTGIFLQAWQQLTGVNFIFYYGTTFFKNSGIANPFMITIATNVVNVVMTIPAFWAVDHIGRRRLLLIGAAGMLVCEYLIAIIGVTISVENQAGQKVLVAFVCIYIAFFASTWGPVAWVVTSEIFPLAIRAKGMSMSTASNWLWNFGIGYATPYMVNAEYGNLQARVFFVWGSTCLGCLVFTYFCIMETKGLSLEQIDILYQNTTPVKSVSYRDQLIAHNVHAADDEAIRKAAGGDSRFTNEKTSQASAQEKV